MEKRQRKQQQIQKSKKKKPRMPELQMKLEKHGYTCVILEEAYSTKGINSALSL